MTHNDYRTTTAAEWRAQAQAARRTAYDSFTRSDTDGFLSQWANDQMAIKYERCAKLAETNWISPVVAAFDLDGNLLSTDYRDGEWGPYFLIRNGDDRPTFLSVSQAQNPKTARRNEERKGFRTGTVNVRWAINHRSGDPFPLLDEVVDIVSTDHYGELAAVA